MRSMLQMLAFGLVMCAPATAAETVPVAHFNSVQLRGGGNVTLRYAPVQRLTIIDGNRQSTRVRVARDGKLEIDACTPRCAPNYRLRVLIESPRFPIVAVSGGGTITAAPGFAPQDTIVAAVSGGGAINLRAISANTVSAAINGGGDILVNPRGTLAAAVNGGGLVRYVGNPRVTTVVNGGGRVEKAR